MGVHGRMETLPLLGPDFGQEVIDCVRPQWAERQLQSNSEGGGEAAAVAQRPGGPPPLVEPSEDGPHRGGEAEHTSPP